MVFSIERSGRLTGMMEVKQLSTNNLVEILKNRGLGADWRLMDAIETVPRHLFIPGGDPEAVYTDTSVPVTLDETGEVVCSATMPSMIGYLLNQLQLEDAHNVLEIGTGTGYVAALIRHMVGMDGKVTSLEIERNIAEFAMDNLVRANISGVNVVDVDGAEGYAPRAAYDRIVASVGVWDIPLPWIRQLKPKGVVVAPVWLDGLQVTAPFTMQPDGTLYAESVMPSAFVYIRGAAAAPPTRKRIGSTALTLISDEIHEVDAAALHTLLSWDDEPSRLSAPLNTRDYWYGFLPYLMLCEPERALFALYHVLDNQKAYGIDGEGFALLTPASACFVPYYGVGFTHNFAGADAYLTIEARLKDWETAGRPGIDRLRLRFIPKANGMPEITEGKVYTRRDHYLHVWMEGVGSNVADAI